MEDEQRKHSREEVWAAISKTNDRLSGVEAQMAGFGSKLDSLASAFQNFVHSHSKPTNWVAIASLVVSVMVAMALWVSQSQEPMKEDIGRIERLSETFMQDALVNASSSGKRAAKIEIMWELIRDNQRRLSKDEGVNASQQSFIESLEQQLDAVDENGSRVWNQKSLP